MLVQRPRTALGCTLQVANIPRTPHLLPTPLEACVCSFERAAALYKHTCRVNAAARVGDPAAAESRSCNHIWLAIAVHMHTHMSNMSLTTLTRIALPPRIHTVIKVLLQQLCTLNQVKCLLILHADYVPVCQCDMHCRLWASTAKVSLASAQLESICSDCCIPCLSASRAKCTASCQADDLFRSMQVRRHVPLHL